MIAIPSAPGVLRAKVVAACRDRGIPVRTLPTVFELLRGGVQLTRQLREVRVEDVLGAIRWSWSSSGSALTSRTSGCW